MGNVLLMICVHVLVTFLFLSVHCATSSQKVHYIIPFGYREQHTHHYQAMFAVTQNATYLVMQTLHLRQRRRITENFVYCGLCMEL